MSLILEALRKSEAERRRGQAPIGEVAVPELDLRVIADAVVVLRRRDVRLAGRPSAERGVVVDGKGAARECL